MLPRWLPQYGLRSTVICALGTVVLVTVQYARATGDDSGLSFRSPSTLDAHVPQQNLDLQTTVIDFLGSGDLASHKKAPVATPQASPSRSTSPDKSALPNNEANLPSKSARTSPFRKWVAPQKSSPLSGQPATGADKASSKLANEPTEPTDRVALRSTRRHRPPRQVPKAKAKEREPLPANTPAEPTPDMPVPSKTAIEAAPAKEVVDSRPLSRSQRNLRTKVRRVLTHYYGRPLNTLDRSPWEVMHAMLAYEIHSKVLQGGPQGKPITAVGWLCFNQSCKRRSLMYINDEGKIRVRVGPALQGHRGQLIAMLAQSDVNREYPLRVEKQDYTVADLIQMEMETCYPRSELTFKLIALMHYLDSDATWMNDQGMEWSIPRLISEELRQPVRGAACGGTHRLSGLTLAYKTRENRGEPVEGEYLRAKKFVRKYQQYAYRLQNGDGSFSTEWFRGPGNEESLDRKLKTTGHLLEWLLYAADEKELNYWRTAKATNYLANIMINNRNKDWEAGPLGHAIHALLLYDRMIFEPHDPPNSQPLATELRRSSKSTLRR